MRSLPRCVSLMLERFIVNTEPIIWLTIFVLAIFVGVEVISKVSSTLHTPLMSGANAIHGVILVGAILVAGSAHSTPILVLGLVAVVLASIILLYGTEPNSHLIAPPVVAVRMTNSNLPPVGLLAPGAPRRFPPSGALLVRR